MEKGAKVYIFIWVVLLVFLLSVVFFNKITGNVIDDSEESEISDENIVEDAPQELNVGDEKQCIKECISEECDSGDLSCMQASANVCVGKCKVKKSEPVIPSKSCTKDCLVRDCEASDKICPEKNKYKCSKECNSIVAPAAKLEEDLCVRECVNNEDSSLTCIPEGDEQIDEICQTCMNNCEQLYDGPCLQEIKLETKLKKCEVCEGCYGALVMGNSKQGYDCVVDVKCKDAKGNVEKQGIFARMFGFFKGMFGGGDKDNSSEKTVSIDETVPEDGIGNSEE